MTLSARSYGSAAGVAAYVRHMLGIGKVFGTDTKPTLAEIEQFLDQQSAKLNGWLASAGYVIPVAITSADARNVLDNFANIGAAGLAELTMRTAGSSADDENNREIKFLNEFESAEAYIRSGALGQLGAVQQQSPGSLFGLSAGGRQRNGQPLEPLFRRSRRPRDVDGDQVNRS